MWKIIFLCGVAFSLNINQLSMEDSKSIIYPTATNINSTGALANTRQKRYMDMSNRFVPKVPRKLRQIQPIKSAGMEAIITPIIPKQNLSPGAINIRQRIQNSARNQPLIKNSAINMETIRNNLRELTQQFIARQRNRAAIDHSKIAQQQRAQARRQRLNNLRTNSGNKFLTPQKNIVGSTVDISEISPPQINIENEHIITEPKELYDDSDDTEM